MKNLVIVSFPAKEGMLENLKETLKAALPDTRSVSYTHLRAHET